MEFGAKIMTLRKEHNLSQENLAEKLGVTRQTISKWELGETSPDIAQAKALSEIFGVSLDDLTDNNVSNVLIEKVSNTEKLAGMVIKILKAIGIILLVLLIIDLIAFVAFTAINFNNSKDKEVVGKYSLTCELDDETYLWEIEYNENFQILTTGGDAFINNHLDISNYDDAHKAVAHIEDWFKDHGGTCKVENETFN